MVRSHVLRLFQIMVDVLFPFSVVPVTHSLALSFTHGTRRSGSEDGGPRGGRECGAAPEGLLCLGPQQVHGSGESSNQESHGVGWCLVPASEWRMAILTSMKHPYPPYLEVIKLDVKRTRTEMRSLFQTPKPEVSVRVGDVLKQGRYEPQRVCDSDRPRVRSCREVPAGRPHY